jgi:4-hydroxy-3-methylbut-2-enyl diphosphate reductase
MSGHKIVDATCPFVKKAQHYAKLLAEEGYQVVILGDANHPEVKGIVSYAGENAVVVSDSDALPKLKSRVGIVVQTTQPVEALKKFVSRAVEQTKELKVYNTICNSTALRLKETEAIAKRADLVFVVGGKNSANTTQLTKLSESLGAVTFHIETASEIRKEWMEGVRLVGVTAGASTPEWIINEVIEKLRDTGG